MVDLVPNRRFASRREVIEAIGEALLACSAVTPPYVEGMLQKEEQGTTIVSADVALPHGTREVRHAVLRNALVIVPIPEGIEWVAGRRVKLAIGFAGTGDRAHLRLLAIIAQVLSDDRMVSRLTTATERKEVVELFDHLLGVSAHEEPTS
jgi:mannitol/fructose-specific phosphotransferase system IIA component